MEIKRQLFTWENGHKALLVEKTPGGTLENRYTEITPRVIWEEGQKKVIEINLPGAYIKQLWDLEQGRLERKEDPRWPVDKLHEYRVDRGVAYYLLSPFTKVRLLFDGLHQTVNVVPQNHQYDPPKTPSITDAYI